MFIRDSSLFLRRDKIYFEDRRAFFLVKLYLFAMLRFTLRSRL